MTEADTTKLPHRPGALGGYVAPILTGLLVVVAGLLPWTLLAQLNARVRPDLPWAALTTVAYFGSLLAWLNGWGPPRRSGDRRRERLRLWPRHTPDADGLTAGVVIVLLGLSYVLWTAISRMSPIPDLSAYPTTAYQWLCGTLARRTGTILPGLVLHVLGDLSRVYFGVLRGDGSLLFVN